MIVDDRLAVRRFEPLAMSERAVLPIDAVRTSRGVVRELPIGRLRGGIDLRERAAVGGAEIGLVPVGVTFCADAAADVWYGSVYVATGRSEM
jgi:hypothetical protein